MHRIPVVGSRDTSRHPRMHRLDQELKILDAGLGQDAVAEIEDVTRSPRGATQDVARTLDHEPGRSEKHGGVEIALRTALESKAAPTLVERNPPVEGDDVRAGVDDRLQQGRGTGAEVDARRGRAKGVEYRFGVRRDLSLVVLD